jgi:hypothetical protein
MNVSTTNHDARRTEPTEPSGTCNQSGVNQLNSPPSSRSSGRKRNQTTMALPT